MRKKVAHVVFEGQSSYKEREPRDRPVPVVEEPPPKKGKGAKGAKGAKGGKGGKGGKGKGAKGVKPPGAPPQTDDANNSSNTTAKATGQSAKGQRDQQH